ncbi:Methyltransferase gidB [Borrelia duttonii CR2A]|uniref:Ribosomal RNA small subunit methyltransferase G n=1 Tax=Borrelia duttonii CR2A TaxID=1432657 RepID=W6TYN1_9SPIR|nr:16S rRNA (guanine(527)-N(7))-methyltransferase RsmG [Borrelia duttonii]ETZ18226.1 Methyltransferase gidB [Borrelia duttonii CR2A]
MMTNFKFALKNLKVNFTSENIDKLRFYIEKVLLFSDRFNLVSNNVRNFDAMLLHALDSVSGLPIVKDKNPRQVLDVGSGAGLPGIVLALFDRCRKYVLLERSNKKAIFLKMISLELGLENVEVLEHNVEEEQNKYEFITIRAFGDIRKYANILGSILKSGGLIMAYKGKFDRVEFEMSYVKNLFDKVEIKSSEVMSDKERYFLLLYDYKC